MVKTVIQFFSKLKMTFSNVLLVTVIEKISTFKGLDSENLDSFFLKSYSNQLID